MRQADPRESKTPEIPLQSTTLPLPQLPMTAEAMPGHRVLFWPGPNSPCSSSLIPHSPAGAFHLSVLAVIARMLMSTEHLAALLAEMCFQGYQSAIGILGIVSAKKSCLAEGHTGFLRQNKDPETVFQFRATMPVLTRLPQVGWGLC